MGPLATFGAVIISDVTDPAKLLAPTRRTPSKAVQTKAPCEVGVAADVALQSDVARIGGNLTMAINDLDDLADIDY
ncbi:MAG TPA: hypothetical protein DCP91_06885 [Eggerthellaceae bacterium]|nr:hypothetical protein [Eggerthellaceae bacterium]